MYPDTDSAPIPIDETAIEAARSALPPLSIAERIERLIRWEVPVDAHRFILRRNLFPLLRRLHETLDLAPRFAGSLVGHVLRHASRTLPVDENRIVGLVGEISDRGLAADILKPLIPVALAAPTASLDELLERIGYRPCLKGEVLAAIDPLREQSEEDGPTETARRNWIMGRLRPIALGNVPLSDLASAVEEVLR